MLQFDKLTSLGWLLFLTITMDVEVLKGEISLAIGNMPTGLHWKMINIGAQGSIPQEQQVKVLHIFVDKLDMALAKLLLMNLYASKPVDGHMFPLNGRMWLVPEIDTILNTKGQANIKCLWACQNTWNMLKLVFLKMWEIELLGHYNVHTKINLRLAMMQIKYSTKAKFNLFTPSIDTGLKNATF